MRGYRPSASGHTSLFLRLMPSGMPSCRCFSRESTLVAGVVVTASDLSSAATSAPVATPGDGSGGAGYSSGYGGVCKHRSCVR